MNEFYDNEVGQQPIDVSASTRKFQQSIVVKQDLNKSGILSFLSEAEQQRQAPQSQIPSRVAGYQ